MDLGSGECLTEMDHLDEDKVSACHGELDLNLAVSKVGIEGLGQENNELGGDRNEVDLKMQEQNGAFSKHELHSSVQYEFDHDEEKSNKIGYNVESLHSDQRKNEVISGKCSDDVPSSPVQAKTCTNELGNEDTDCLTMEVPEALNSRYQLKNMGKENYPCDGGLKENAEAKFQGSLRLENSESAFVGMRGGDGERVMGKPDDDYKAEKEDMYYSGNLVPINGKLEGKKAELRSPGRTFESSVSPVRRMSTSPEKSPDVEERSAGLKLPSSPHGVQESSYSPRSYEPKRPPSPESSGEDGKRVLPQDHPSNSGRRSSTSPRRRSRRHSPRGDESLQKPLSISPRRRHKSPDRRRRDRSVSRSPARRNDSSSRHRRHDHDRSQSKSPRARDHHRRSPRRYSPRRQSPPSGYYSRRRSPRRRPWSPPPNRKNGIGKPGNNLFVAGFSFMTTERDLERKFSRFGHVRDVRIVRDKRSGDSRGFGFLSLERDEDADAAIRSLDQTEWNGRVVLVEKSKSR